MNCVPLEISHLTGFRLYVLPASQNTNENDLKLSVFDSATGQELYGAGMRSYGKPIGRLLSSIGIASKIYFGERSFYIDNRSFSKFILRDMKMEKMESSNQSTAEKLHHIYKTTSYSWLFRDDKDEDIELIEYELSKYLRNEKKPNFLTLKTHLEKSLKRHHKNCRIVDAFRFKIAKCGGTWLIV